MDKMEFNKMVQCPYDVSHFILRERFQVHLDKCRVNHKDETQSHCPFNITHVVNHVELDWHVTICPDRKGYEHYMHKDETFKKTATPPKFQPIESSENWDDEPDVPTYNPQAYVKGAPVLRNLKGAPLSKRKAFRKEERLRFLGFNKDDE